MNLSLLVGYNLAYSAAYTVQFLVAFSSLIFINIILDKKFYLDWQELQDFKVRKSSDPLSTVFSVKWQKQRQKAQELTGDVTRGYLHFCTQSSVQTLFLSWPLYLPLSLILWKSEGAALHSKPRCMTWAMQTITNLTPTVSVLLCSFILVLKSQCKKIETNSLLHCLRMEDLSSEEIGTRVNNLGFKS